MKKRRYTPPHKYTDEQKRFIVEKAWGISSQELLDNFNAAFETRLTLDQIKGAMTRYGARTGRDTRFVKGQKSWNEGRKGVRVSIATEFKPGNIPANHLPVGSEVLATDGYWKVKIAEPNKWRQKHRLVWEQAHGEIPKGNAVVFADGNRSNFELDNLVLVTRAELLIANRQRLIFADKDVTKTGLNVARVLAKTYEAKKK